MWQGRVARGGSSSQKPGSVVRHPPSRCRLQLGSPEQNAILFGSCWAKRPRTTSILPLYVCVREHEPDAPSSRENHEIMTLDSMAWSR